MRETVCAMRKRPSQQCSQVGQAQVVVCNWFHDITTQSSSCCCCCCLLVACRWDEPKFPLRRPIQETINKISEIMGHIEDDLKVCSAGFVKRGGGEGEGEGDLFPVTCETSCTVPVVQHRKQQLRQRSQGPQCVAQGPLHILKPWST